jgi:hypothetical protein
MGGSSGGGTTRTEPPKYQLPYLQDSLGYAKDQYTATSGGQGVAPLSSESNQALAGMSNLAQSGNTVNQAGSNLAMQTLNGGFLGSNPYLDQTFNRAAQATQGQLASQFAGSGRNISASEGNRADQLNGLATQIYGGAYDQERNRQQQVLGMAPQLGQAQYGDLNALASVGASREGYQQEQLDAPGNALDEFISRISGNMGQTMINTGSRNRSAGALGGAMMGSQLGSQYGGYGSAIGGLLGGAAGGWG